MTWSVNFLYIFNEERLRGGFGIKYMGKQVYLEFAN